MSTFFQRSRQPSSLAGPGRRRATLLGRLACVVLASCAEEDGGRASRPGAADAGTALLYPDACTGTCTSAPPPPSTKVCDGDLVNIATDPYNCGDCGVKCKLTESCRDAKCTCDFAMCGGECVDTSADPRHCGGCDSPCDYTCANGTCGPRVLALTDKRAAFLAVDDTNVYWLESGAFCPYALRKCVKSGCDGKATTLADPVCAADIAAGGGNVFLADQDALKTCNGSSGCANAPIVFAASQTPRALAIDASYVYWSDLRTHWIMKCPIGGPCSSPAVVAVTEGSGVPEWSVAVDTANVYWIEYKAPDYRLATRALSGGPNTVLVSGAFPQSIAAGSGRLYFEGAGILTCAATGCGGAPTTYFNSANTSFRNVKTDGTDVYFSDRSAGAASETIRRCALGATCSAPAVVASNLQQGVGALAVDAKNVYWIEGMAIKSYKKK